MQTWSISDECLMEPEMTLASPSCMSRWKTMQNFQVTISLPKRGTLEKNISVFLGWYGKNFLLGTELLLKNEGERSEQEVKCQFHEVIYDVKC